MYNRLLFDCPQLAVDVIFAAVSNQCPQRPPLGKLFPPSMFAAEGLIEVRKEAFLRRLRTASGVSFEAGLPHTVTEDSFQLTTW
jgi:hypothetical protein